MLGSEAGDSQRAPSATHSGPVSLVGGASRNEEPNGIDGPINPPAATTDTWSFDVALDDVEWSGLPEGGNDAGPAADGGGSADGAADGN